MKIATGRVSCNAAAATGTLRSERGISIAASHVSSAWAVFGEVVVTLVLLEGIQSRSMLVSCSVSFPAQNQNFLCSLVVVGDACNNLLRHASVPGRASFVGPLIGYRDNASATTLSFPGL